MGVKLVTNRIKAIREERGISQNQLSKLSGLQQATICRIESEYKDFKISSAISIARALGVSVEDLIVEIRETDN